MAQKLADDIRKNRIAKQHNRNKISQRAAASVGLAEEWGKRRILAGPVYNGNSRRHGGSRKNQTRRK